MSRFSLAIFSVWSSFCCSKSLIFLVWISLSRYFCNSWSRIYYSTSNILAVSTIFSLSLFYSRSLILRSISLVLDFSSLYSSSYPILSFVISYFNSCSFSRYSSRIASISLISFLSFAIYSSFLSSIFFKLSFISSSLSFNLLSSSRYALFNWRFSSVIWIIKCSSIMEPSISIFYGEWLREEL